MKFYLDVFAFVFIFVNIAAHAMQSAVFIAVLYTIALFKEFPYLNPVYGNLLQNQWKYWIVCAVMCLNIGENCFICPVLWPPAIAVPHQLLVKGEFCSSEPTTFRFPVWKFWMKVCMCYLLKQYSSIQFECYRKSNGTVSSLEVVSSFKAKRNPLKQYSQVERLLLHDWPLQRPAVDTDFDLGVVVSFGHLIPESLISSFRL